MPKLKDREEIFTAKAEKIHKYLRTDIRYDRNFIPRPFFLEFTGSPSSGKTTTITELDKFFRRLDFRVWRPQEGAEVIRHIPRTTPVYNIRTGQYALNLLLDLSFGNQYDIVIFDRCIFDAYCWMMYWRERGQLSAEEMSVAQSFFLSDFWVGMIDAAYFVVCDAKEAMEREMRLSMTQKTGETSNPQTIESLVARYRSAHATLSPRHGQLFLVDTTHLGEEEMVEKFTNDILDVLLAKIKAMR